MEGRRLKRLIGLTVSVALAAGPAAAQGTFSPEGEPSSTFGSGAPKPGARPSTYGVPAQPPATASKPRTYWGPEAPKAPGFEPYKPFAGSSVYARPSGSGSSGAKPCESSVYANACDKRR